MSIPNDLKYTEEHEWIRDNHDGTYTVGITDHAQHALGDLVYVELPEMDNYDAGDEVAVLESVKAASDMYCPISGEVTAVNEQLEDEPETINTDAYDKGWVFKLTSNASDEFKALMNADQYTTFTEDND